MSLGPGIETWADMIASVSAVYLARRTNVDSRIPDPPHTPQRQFLSKSTSPVSLTPSDIAPTATYSIRSFEPINPVTSSASAVMPSYQFFAPSASPQPGTIRNQERTASPLVGLLRRSNSSAQAHSNSVQLRYLVSVKAKFVKIFVSVAVDHVEHHLREPLPPWVEQNCTFAGRMVPLVEISINNVSGSCELQVLPADDLKEPYLADYGAVWNSFIVAMPVIEDPSPPDRSKDEESKLPNRRKSSGNFRPPSLLLASSEELVESSAVSFKLSPIQLLVQKLQINARVLSIGDDSVPGLYSSDSMASSSWKMMPFLAAQDILLEVMLPFVKQPQAHPKPPMFTESFASVPPHTISFSILDQTVRMHIQQLTVFFKPTVFHIAPPMIKLAMAAITSINEIREMFLKSNSHTDLSRNHLPFSSSPLTAARVAAPAISLQLLITFEKFDIFIPYTLEAALPVGQVPTVHSFVLSGHRTAVFAQPDLGRWRMRIGAPRCLHDDNLFLTMRYFAMRGSNPTPWGSTKSPR